MFDTELAHGNATDERLETIKARLSCRSAWAGPTELAELICYLASEHAGYINGASIDINGGSLFM